MAEIFCQDLNAVKKFSDCINDVKTHLKQGETKENGMSFITKLKKKVEMHVPRDRFNMIEPRMLSDGMQLSRALVSVAQKIGTANASGTSVPQSRLRALVFASTVKITDVLSCMQQGCAWLRRQTS